MNWEQHIDGFSEVRSLSLPELRCNAYASRRSIGKNIRKIL